MAEYPRPNGQRKCPKGHGLCNLFQVKKAGPNTGKWFYTCPMCNNFQWAPGSDAVRSPTPPRHGAEAAGPSSQPLSGAGPSTSPYNPYSPYPTAPSPSPSPNPSRALPASFRSPTAASPAGLQVYSQSPGWGGVGTPPGAGGAGVEVDLQALPDGMLGASTATFSQAFIDHIKQLEAPLRQWNPDAKCWSFQSAHYDQVVAHLQKGGFRVKPIPRDILAAITSPAPKQEGALGEAEVERVMEQQLGPALLQKLLAFQVEGVRRGVRAGGRVLLADDMGLGKTVQAICIAACFPDSWPLLVVCPSSMRLTWRAALQQWLPPRLRPEPEDLALISKGKDIGDKLQGEPPNPQRHVCITSYDLVQKLPPSRLAAYRSIICDESHALKSPSAARTKFMSKVVRKAPRAVLLTGTPLLSRPIEVWPQVDMLRPGFLGTFHQFGDRYCQPAQPRPGQQYYPGQQYRGARNLPELHARLRPLMVRRTKEDVLHDMPPKLRQRVMVDVDPQYTGQLAAIKAAMRAAEADGDDNARKALLAEFYRATGPAKVAACWEYIEELLQRGTKLLLFAHHHTVLAALRMRLQQYARSAAPPATQPSQEVPDEAAPAPSGSRRGRGRGGASGSRGKGAGRKRRRGEEEGEDAAEGEAGGWGFVSVDGSTSDVNRHEAVQRFQNDENCRVALLSITAAGVGLTLTKAAAVVFAELYWNPGTLVQAEDRAHRLGQERSVMVHYLTAPGTCDDLMWRLANFKLKVLGATLDNASGPGLKQATPEETSAWERQAAELAAMGTPPPSGTSQRASQAQRPISPVPLRFPSQEEDQATDKAGPP